MKALLFALAVLLLAPARGARAAEPPNELARAETLYREAMAHSQRGEYDQAVPLLEEGYRLSRLPGFLFNLAQAQRLRGNCGEAVRHYRAFIAADPGAPERKQAEAHVAALAPCPPPAGPDPGARAAAAIPVPPAPAPAPVSVRAPAPAPATGGTSRTLGLVALGGGVLAGGGALYYLLQARDAESQVNARYEVAGGTWDDAIAGVESDGRRASTRGRVLGAIGAGLAVTGATLYYLGARSHGAEATIAVAPAPGGAHVAWTGRF